MQVETESKTRKQFVEQVEMESKYQKLQSSLSRKSKVFESSSSYYSFKR